MRHCSGNEDFEKALAEIQLDISHDGACPLWIEMLAYWHQQGLSSCLLRSYGQRAGFIQCKGQLLGTFFTLNAQNGMSQTLKRSYFSHVPTMYLVCFKLDIRPAIHDLQTDKTML